jgi:hypothetical protein
MLMLMLVVVVVVVVVVVMARSPWVACTPSTAKAETEQRRRRSGNACWWLQQRRRAAMKTGRLCQEGQLPCVEVERALGAPCVHTSLEVYMQQQRL